MNNLKDLRKLIQHGDYTRIAEIFNRRHKKLDRKRVSLPYVHLVLKGRRRVSDGTIAQEVVAIAEQYLATKNRVVNDLIVASD